MPQYTFVAVEGGDAGLSNITSSIRSHAIRSGLQRASRRARLTARSLRTNKSRGEFSARLEAYGRFGELQCQVGPSSPLPSELMNPDRDRMSGYLSPKYHSLARDSTNPYWIESVSAGCVDPFNSLPIPANPAVDQLIRYFLTKYNTKPDTVDRSRSWFPYALQSAPMMHSTLAMVASLWQAKYPRLEYSVRFEGMRQKGEAMREIRARLAHAGSAGNDIERAFLMSTMSTLVIVAVYDDDFDAAKTHLGCVKTLFSLRDGRNSLDDDFILCKSINLADVLVAVALGHRLMFPLLHGEVVHLPASILEETQRQPLHPVIIRAAVNDYSWTFIHLRQLLVARQSPMVSEDDLRILLNILDNTILDYLYQGGIETYESNTLFRALMLAAHVFMYVTLRHVPPGVPLLRRMCARLQQATIGLIPSTQQVCTEHQAAFLWIAFVGVLGMGTTAETCPDGRWFLGFFQRMAGGQSPGFSKDDDRRMLSAFLWDDVSCESVLARLDDCGSGM
ncbi:hypothetical protein ACHAQJ_005942 [Trichoderma viride]